MEGDYLVSGGNSVGMWKERDGTSVHVLLNFAAQRSDNEMITQEYVLDRVSVYRLIFQHVGIARWAPPIS